MRQTNEEVLHSIGDLADNIDGGLLPVTGTMRREVPRVRELARTLGAAVDALERHFDRYLGRDGGAGTVPPSCGLRAPSWRHRSAGLIETSRRCTIRQTPKEQTHEQQSRTSIASRACRSLLDSGGSWRHYARLEEHAVPL